ncbi:hypothetical protein [Mycobacterium sp. 236(2023)]|uniref:hypothetical protein n=1 Tax=Mycobacterium sp. 236(2023) TaxID=3038163 RepID=UPI0024158DC0|nr:hypothetical protein [Mycobacterium sp. 236(2023)]MDG4667993.1 hypothetical protein [Mycobacterium sp. 236(2023)]
MRGEFHEVHCAVRADDGCPAGDFLDALRTGMWEPDPDADQLPDDEQISDWHWFLNALRHWATTGEPVYAGAVNDLDDGIWEFKRAKKRLSFYDTDGRGNYDPKLRAKDVADVDPRLAGSAYWDIPYFDPAIRLGHAFPKVSQATPRYDLDATQRVREEDLEHDRTT